MKREFYRDLNQFVKDFDTDIERLPTIEGCGIELFDLYTAVGKQHVALEQVDWLQVAEDLSFNWVDFPAVPDKLAECYERNLAEFQRAMDAFEAEEEGGDDDGTIVGPSSIAASQDQDANDDVELPPLSIAGSALSGTSSHSLPSSPTAAVFERKSATGRSSDSHFSSSKRRKLDRNAEIPATPAERWKSSSYSISRGPTPSRPKADQNYMPSPRRRSGNVEPETQDFAFQETQRYTLDPDESFDVTPSQQLRNESDTVLPITLNLSRAHHSNGMAESVPTTHALSRTESRRSEASSVGESTAKASRRKLPESYARSNPSTAPRATSSGERAARRSPSLVPKKPTQGCVSSPEQAEDNTRQMSEWIEYYERLGYARDTIMKAFRATTLFPDLAGRIMPFIVDGRGIPDNIQGVWTARDDESLKYIDSIQSDEAPGTMEEWYRHQGAQKEWRQLVKKHELERIEKRRNFLAGLEQLERTLDQ
jgi:hypothetical protein